MFLPDDKTHPAHPPFVLHVDDYVKPVLTRHVHVFKQVIPATHWERRNKEWWFRSPVEGVPLMQAVKVADLMHPDTGDSAKAEMEALRDVLAMPPAKVKGILAMGKMR